MIHQDTPRYKLTIQCILDASWCWHGLIVSESQVLPVNELVEMHGSCPPERRERLERMKGPIDGGPYSYTIFCARLTVIV